MPRFVILRHEMPQDSQHPSHWDWMFEHDGALVTWAVEAPPDAPGDQPALRLPDHRLAYLDYEGPVSGNRGQVTRCERGEYRAIEISDTQWLVELEGESRRGSVEWLHRSLQRWTLSTSSARK